MKLILLIKMRNESYNIIKGLKRIFFLYILMVILMKKVLLLLIWLLFPILVKGITATSYIVMDQDSGRILESSNKDKESLIASTTKIMTALVALEYGNKEDVVKINDDVLEAYGSGIYVEVGEKLTLDDLLYGLLLRSGNDAALAIASYVGDGIDNFVYLMNERAKKIGMEHTTFINPSGLENNKGEGNISTVYDMALLMKEAMQNEDFRRITGTKEITIKSSLKTYHWDNKNKLLQNYEYCTGGKTGYTKKAHRTLVTTASKDNMNLIVVTFNDGNDFNDHEILYNKYFNNYERVQVLDKEVKYVDNTKIKNDFYVVKKKDEVVEVKIEMNEYKESTLNGEVVGKIKVLLNNEVVGYRNLFYEVVSKQEDKSFISKLINLLKFWE